MTAPTDGDGAMAASRVLYDRYFRSRDYRRRYPRPNTGTLQCVLALAAQGADHVLDVGCGNGRYTVALLQRTGARITANDISEQALLELAQSLAPGGAVPPRLRLVHGPVAALPAEPGDLILLLFGVLSHVATHRERVQLLRQLRARAHERSHLVLTVPSLWRRRPLELLASLVARLRGAAPGPALGDIHFRRVIDGQRLEFFYHLYTLQGLRGELAEGGWRMESAAPESFLPEWLVTQSAVAEALDRAIQRVLPAALGYGIRVVASPLPPHEGLP